MRHSIFLLALFVVSFDSISASNLIIKSQPDTADVYIVSGQRPVKLGVTPYQANLNEVIETYVKTSSFMIELRKPGHEIYRVIVSKSTNVDIELSANLELSRSITNIRAHDLLMNQLFDVQKLIRGRNFADAIGRLTELEVKHPELSVIPELKATAYYMNKEVENALSYYRKAFTLNPDNADAYRMKVYLEKKMNISSEAK